jgi:hypothetical protein
LFAQALKSSSLLELNLSLNPIGCLGVSSLCCALKSEGCNLKILILDKCLIKITGLNEITFALMNKNCKLTKLDLSRNNLEGYGANSNTRLNKAIQNCCL